MKINIYCKTGFSLPLEEIHYYPGNLKKHSMLEIERVTDSIEKDGFLFPVTVGKVGDKNYIIDGECAVDALWNLKNRGTEIPEIPVVYVKSDEETIKRNILIATSTNHCVTKYSLENFCSDKNLLKELSFNEGTLIDFYNEQDIDRCFEVVNKKLPKVLNDKKQDFVTLLEGGLI